MGERRGRGAPRAVGSGGAGCCGNAHLTRSHCVEGRAAANICTIAMEGIYIVYIVYTPRVDTGIPVALLYSS